jgi:hypothetical protein
MSDDLFEQLELAGNSVAAGADIPGASDSQ